MANEWINHPDLKNLDPIKLQLIRTAAANAGNKTGKDLAPVMMALISSAGKKGIRFTPDEFSLILEILKGGKSDQAKQNIDQMVQMVKGYIK